MHPRDRESTGGTVGRHVAADRAWTVVGVAVVTLVVGFLSARLLGLGRLVYAVAVPAGVLFGPAGAVGFAFGGLSRDLLAGVAVPVALVRAGSDALLAVVGYTVWGRRPIPTLDRPSSVPSGLAGYAVAVVVASLCGAAALASGLAVVGRTSFAASAPTLLTDRLVAGLALGAVVLVGVASTVDGLPDPDGGRRLPTGAVLGATTVALVWLAGGFAFSLVQADAAAFPGVRTFVTEVLPPVLEPVASAALSWLYRPLQALLALVALAAIGALVVRAGGGGGGEDRPVE
ncbi:MAG: hypothetical protein ABEJ40_07505 [Haloarculaceae archaeon]